MKRQLFTLASFLLLVVMSAQASKSSQLTSTRNAVWLFQTKTATVTTDEQLIRSAYDKLVTFNRSEVQSSLPNGRRLTDDDILWFELSNFKVGSLQNISSDRVDAWASIPDGEIISL